MAQILIDRLETYKDRMQVEQVISAAQGTNQKIQLELSLHSKFQKFSNYFDCKTNLAIANSQ